ncbi:uncharacterized protein LOC143849642 [Tasmannia lanceolata]|uniref:uncharacterized protein LOC143849642 n=1 Tax=Tasmannia lanceolata TaxID=3420 RepID=UPI0040639BF4
MNSCKTLVRTPLSSFQRRTQRIRRNLSSISVRNLNSISANFSNQRFRSLVSPNQGLGLGFYPNGAFSRSLALAQAAVSGEITDQLDETVSNNSTVEIIDESTEDRVEELLANANEVSDLMKMERRSDIVDGGGDVKRRHWFPYLDLFRTGSTSLTSSEVLEALDPYILEGRKERIREVVKNRSYGVCLAVEGLTDFGNVSAVLRSADALGVQSIHVISCDGTKRYRDNRHVSMGAEKWLDIELWKSTQQCFKVLKSRGYRVATTHVGTDAVSIYDMDWSCPTAIVVGNEHKGISDEALELSDLHCSIPMNGMVDSFNVSVASGILMHHAVCDRISRMGSHGDLTDEELQILLAEFFLRHSKSTVSIAHEYVKRKVDTVRSKL